MAYLRDIKYPCQSGGCASRAVVQLVTFRNEHMGRYCRRHGNEALRSQKRIEANIFAEQRREREQADA